jgi:hypothetical protein
MRQLITSRFFIAVIAFGALSLLAGWMKLCAVAAEDFPYYSWTAWAIDDFLHQKTPAKIVFMGSSLVLVPLSGVDADFLQQKLDGSQHHQSVYFERKFAEKTGLNVSTFNFALPGEMPSDAYMITSFLLKGDKRPDVIVYGVGPRDFMDNLLPSPAATDPYRFLSRFGDVSPFASLMMPDFFERMSFETGRALYLYGHKSEIAGKLVASAGDAFNHDAPWLFRAAAMTNEERHQLLPDYQAFALGRGEAFFRPSTPEDRAKFVDNLAEYKKRYKNLKRQTFMTQMRFFTEALATAKARGVHAIVVAMPITDINRQLLSDANWDEYRTNIKTIARNEGATLVDFNEDGSFKRSDFGDTVHLHSGGGKLWLDKLIDRLAGDRDVVASLEERGRLARTADLNAPERAGRPRSNAIAGHASGLPPAATSARVAVGGSPLAAGKGGAL